jgi:hypothetical protein
MQRTKATGKNMEWGKRESEVDKERNELNYKFPLWKLLNSKAKEKAYCQLVRKYKLSMS